MYSGGSSASPAGMSWRKSGQGSSSCLVPQLSAMYHLDSLRRTTLTGNCSTQSGFKPSVTTRVAFWMSMWASLAVYPPPGWCLIGDVGYPCLAQPICLMTPFCEPVRNAVEGRYNTRCVVERAFGVLKTRWRSIFLLHFFFFARGEGGVCV